MIHVMGERDGGRCSFEYGVLHCGAKNNPHSDNMLLMFAVKKRALFLVLKK